MKRDYTNHKANLKAASRGEYLSFVKKIMNGKESCGVYAVGYAV